MKQNRKVSNKMSVVARNSTAVGAIVASGLVAAILYICASSSCTQLHNRVGAKEKLLERLEAERERESARWEEMKTPERLEQALAKHGLDKRAYSPGRIEYRPPARRNLALELVVRLGYLLVEMRTEQLLRSIEREHARKGDRKPEPDTLAAHRAKTVMRNVAECVEETLAYAALLAGGGIACGDGAARTLRLASD